MADIDRKLDLLREIFNIGVGGAATALSKIVKIPIMITVPEVSIIGIDKVITCMGPADKRVVTIYIHVSENFPSGILLIFDEDSAKKLVRLSDAKSRQDLDDKYFISVLNEIANIMCSYFLNNFSKFIKRSLMPGTPLFAVDMCGAVIDSVILNYGAKGGDVLLIKTELFNQNEKFFFNFMLIPETDSLMAILEKI